MIDYYLVFLAGVVPGYAVRHPRLGRVAYALMAVSGNTMVALYGMKIASVREFGPCRACHASAAQKPPACPHRRHRHRPADARGA